MESKEKKVDWFERLSRLAGPIIGGLLVAVIAFQGDQIVTNYTSRQENARLITQLQIQREQAESDLRKDVFDQAIAALLSEEELRAGDKLSLSKRLMKLELLAHNFGGSLNLSPLFVEFNRDLEDQKLLPNNKIADEIRIEGLQRRLRSLARRLASEQLSALAQHGMVFEIKAPLEQGGNEYGDELKEYSWPYHAAIEPVRGLDLDDPAARAVIDSEILRLGDLTFDDISRSYKVVLDDLDPSDQEVSVTLEICWGDACEGDPQIYRPFTLDYFNFPKIDNTRLSENQRFAMVLEEFRTDGENPELVLAAVVFPSEHSSLRDRPSMGEAVDLLNSVLESQDDDEEESSTGEDSDAE